MEDFRDIRHSPEFRNYLSIDQSLGELGNFLEDYMKDILRGIHNSISTRLATGAICAQNCSRLYPNDQRWCQTCRSWKQELSTYFRGNWQQKMWFQLDSNRWPIGYDEITKVFLPPAMNQNANDLKDISTLLNLFQSLAKCNQIPMDLIKSLKGLRNRYKHGNAMRACARDRDKMFRLIRTLIHVPDVTATINVNDVQERMDKIQNGELLRYDIDVMEILQRIDENTQNFNRANVVSDIFMFLASLIKEYGRSVVGITTCILLNAVHAAFIGAWGNKHRRWFLSLMLMIGLLCQRTGIENENTACFDENFRNPWPNDLKLVSYLRTHKSLTGRKWLLENIENHLRSDRPDSSGVLLAADMGYGKSALASHLTCAQVSEGGHWITSRLLAVYVCQYDAQITHNPALMIRTFIGLISKNMPAFFSSLTMFNHTRNHFSVEACTLDPVGCMDQGIILPLNELDNSTEPWIILIDALDECQMYGNSHSPIVDLLYRTIHKFPKWIKFLITSRKDVKIMNKMRELTQMTLDASDERNVKDIKDFLAKQVLSEAPLKTKLIACFKSSENVDIIDEVVELSRGNFLYLIHALKYWSTYRDEHCARLPSSFDKILEFNFMRQFGKFGEWFDNVRLIFEIMCAIRSPIEKSELFEIYHSIQTNVTLQEFQTILLNCSHFLKVDNNRVKLLHIGVYAWLSSHSRQNTPFFIIEQTGHNAIVQYLLKKVKERGETIDVVALANHAVQSQNHNSVSQVEQLSRYALIHDKTVDNRTDEDILNHLILTANNSFDITRLALNFVKNIDAGRDRKVTAAYLACSLGHDKSLLALLEAGADITFKGPFDKTRTVWDEQDKLMLLDIAVKNGHLEVAKVLLKQNKTLLTEVDGVYRKTSAFPFACYNGLSRFLELFFEVQPSLVNQLCLHHAALNGHLEIVSMLLHRGVVDKCIPCQEKANWADRSVKTGKDDIVFQTEIGEATLRQSEILLVLSDKDDLFWLIFCETALHAAAKRGHLEVVRRLASQKQNATGCTDRFGKTPFLSAIIRNQTQIAISLAQVSNFTVKCANTEHILGNLNEAPSSISAEIPKEMCPCGRSALHFITSMNLTHLMFAFETMFPLLNWAVTDCDGVQPFHLAACHGNSFVMHHIGQKINLDINLLLTLNSSTPLHSAVICRSVDGVHILTKFFSPNAWLVKDYRGLTALHYLALSNIQFQSATHSLSEDKYVKKIMDILYQAKVPMETLIRQRDIVGRNVIHYAITSGNIVLFYQLYEKYPDQIILMLTEKDLNGHTPIVIAIETLRIHSKMQIIAASNSQWDDNVYKLARWCSLKDIFNSTCEKKTSVATANLMTSKEFLIIRVLELLKRKGQVNGLAVHIHHIIEKGSIHLTSAWLFYLNAYDIQNKNGETPLTTFLKKGREPCTGGLLFAGKRQNLLQPCGKPLFESPLHAIAMFIRNRFWFYRPSATHFYSGNIDEWCVNSRYFWNIAKFFYGSNLDKCYDKGGFNILHRALIGGGYRLALFLIDHLKMTLGTKTQFGITVVETAVLEHKLLKKALHTEETDRGDLVIQDCDVEGTCSSTKFSKMFIPFDEYKFTPEDNSATSFLTELTERGLLNYEMICSQGTQRLSVIHLSSINGLVKTIEYIKNRWGSTVLKCRNADGITPKYLVHRFQRGDLSKGFYSNVTADSIRPEIELLILLNISPRSKVYLPSEELVDCVFKTVYGIKSPLAFIKARECVEKASMAISRAGYSPISYICLLLRANIISFMKRLSEKFFALQQYEHDLNMVESIHILKQKQRSHSVSCNSQNSIFIKECLSKEFRNIVPYVKRFGKRFTYIFRKYGIETAILDRRVTLIQERKYISQKAKAKFMELWNCLMRHMYSKLYIESGIWNRNMFENNITRVMIDSMKTMTTAFKLYRQNRFSYLRVFKYTKPRNKWNQL